VTSPDELRERLALAICNAEWGARREREQPWSEIQGVDRDEYLAQAEAVLAVVTPELERRDAEIEQLKADMGIRHGALNGVLGRSGNPSPSDYYEAIGEVADLVNAARRLARLGSESVPATPEPSSNERQACSKLLQDLELALAKPGGSLYRRLVDWLDEPLNRTDATSAADTAASAVHWFMRLVGERGYMHAEADRLSSGVDLPGVEAAPLEDLEHLPEAAMDKLVRETLCDSATSEASQEEDEPVPTLAALKDQRRRYARTSRVVSASSPPSAGEADTAPRVWKAGDAEPPAWVVALAQPPGSYWKYLIRGTKGGWYFSNSLTPEAPIVEGSGWGWAISRAELPLTQVTEVRDCHGDVWTWVPGTFEWSSPETQNCAWSYMAKKWRPLVEVLPNTEQAPSPSQGGGTDG
jgi:hypothetical protein